MLTSSPYAFSDQLLCHGRVEGNHLFFQVRFVHTHDPIGDFLVGVQVDQADFRTENHPLPGKLRSVDDFGTGRVCLPIPGFLLRADPETVLRRRIRHFQKDRRGLGLPLWLARSEGEALFSSGSVPPATSSSLGSSSVRFSSGALPSVCERKVRFVRAAIGLYHPIRF